MINETGRLFIKLKSIVFSNYVCWNMFNTCTVYWTSADVNWQTFNSAVRVFTFSPYYVFKYIEIINTVFKYIEIINTVFKYIEINAFINSLVNTQLYLHTIVFILPNSEQEQWRTVMKGATKSYMLHPNCRIVHC